MKRAIPLLVMTLFLAGIFIVPGVGNLSTAHLQEASSVTSVTDIVNEIQTAALPNDPVFRVAFYNESETATPSYGITSLTNNYTQIMDVLDNSAYDITYLNETDILNYELTTTNYDVLILADNVPRDSIVNITRDFWLGGGGVLALDSAAAFLGYAGILPKDNESKASGYPLWWTYDFGNVSNIVEKNPISQSYTNGSQIIHKYGKWGVYNWTRLLANATYSGYLTKIALLNGTDDHVTALSIDGFRGGRAAYFGIPVPDFPTDWEDMLLDAIAWLAPKPKARIAYDFSHQPRLSIDDWDVFSTLTDATEKFEDLRDAYVSNRYTFDKFVPLASGNFTQARLAEYDIMILAWPDLNYTEAERTALMAWLDAGGGLIVLGDRNLLAGLGQGYLFLNFLLEDLDMYYGENDTLDFQNAVITHPTHPTVGSATSLRISYRNYLYLSGPAAQSVWEYDGNIAVAAQEYGSGRVVMLCDMNIFSNPVLSQQHNRGYALNVANWLSADEATILVYSDDPYDGGAYRSSVAQVLNQMEIPFHMTVSDVGFNASVNGTWFAQDWDLVILDHNNYFYSIMYDGLFDYLQNGGRAIVNTFRMNSLPDHPIWRFMGANFSASWPVDASAYIWDTDSDIFNTPINYTASSLNVSGATYGDDGDMVTVFDNATALAGFTTSEEIGNASIVLRNDGTTLLNSFLLNNMRGDIDDSAYLDTFELWFDQIAFMLNMPSIDHPADIEYESGSTGNTITWTPSHSAPSSYDIYVNGSHAHTATWDGSAITYNIDGLSLGEHPVEVFVYGDSTDPRGDTVVVTVVDTTDPLLSSPADLTMTVNTTGNTLTWVASDFNPSHFVILMNSTGYEAGVWDGSSVVLDLDDLTPGIYFFTIRVNDTMGHISEDTVLVTVNEPSLFGGLDTNTLILIAAAVLGLIIIMAICKRKKK